MGLTNRKKDGPGEKAALPAAEQAHGDGAQWSRKPESGVRRAHSEMVL